MRALHFADPEVIRQEALNLFRPGEHAALCHCQVLIVRFEQLRIATGDHPPRPLTRGREAIDDDIVDRRLLAHDRVM
jgi:hypothetical protein